MLAPGDGVLLVAHGTVSDLADLPEFLKRIRRGKPASEELVLELRRRYEHIGGSPLNEISRQQASRLSRALDAPVFIANRLWSPSVEQALTAATRLGLERICVVPLAPFSVSVYLAAARSSWQAATAEITGIPKLVEVEPWGLEPAFIAAHARKIAPFIEADDGSALVLTAHSLPVAVIAAGDPYEREVRRTAEAIAATLGRPYRLAFQSQGADGGEWLGPDLLETLSGLRDEGVDRVVIAPFGFLAEHVETLFDLDVEAARWAKDKGLEFTRVPALNDDPGLIEALKSVAVAALSR